MGGVRAVGKFLGHKSLKQVDRAERALHRALLLPEIDPAYIEPDHHARLQQQCDVNLCSEVVRVEARDSRGGQKPLRPRATEQIDRVLDAPGACERPGVNRAPEQLGQPLEVDSLAHACKIAGLGEQAPVHVVRDDTRARCRRSLLQERRPGLSQRAEHHLPARIERRARRPPRPRRPRVRLQRGDPSATPG